MALSVKPVQMMSTSWFEWLVFAIVFAMMIALGLETDWWFQGLNNWGQSVSSAMGHGITHAHHLPGWIEASPAYALMATGTLNLLEGTRLASQIPPLAILYGVLQLSSMVLVFTLSRAHLPRPYPTVVMLLYGAYDLMNANAGLPSAAWVQGVFSLAALAAMGWAFRYPELPPQPDKLFITSLCVSAAVWTHWLGWVVLATFWIKGFSSLGIRRMPMVIVMTMIALAPGVLLQWDAGEFQSSYGANNVLWHPLFQGVDNLIDAHKPLAILQQNAIWTINQWTDAIVGLPESFTPSQDGPMAAVATPINELSHISQKGILAIIPWPCWIVGLLTFFGWIYTVRFPQTAIELYVLLTLLVGGLVMADAQSVALPVWPLTLMLMMLGLHRLSLGLGSFGLPIGKILTPGIGIWVGLHLWQVFLSHHPDFILPI